MSSDADIMRILKRCRDDFPYFCENILQVKRKADGMLVPFRLNKSQIYFHNEVERIKKERGKVRVILVKARQLGLSTYISARFYHKILFNKGASAFVFAHNAESSNNLFGMVLNYISEPQVSGIFPTKLGKKNQKLIEYDALRSRYRVGTAGSEGLGRSMTLQYVHWSEVAFSQNAKEHIEGLLNTVPSADGTEIILESTANGMTDRGETFYNMTMASLNKESAFVPVFIPYFYDDEYSIPISRGEEFVLDPEKPDPEILSEQEYFNEHEKHGLTKEHLKWRREKILDLSGGVQEFRQEYPADIHEAFATTITDAFISPVLVQKAWDTKHEQDTSYPVIMGIDPAGHGKDQFAIAFRQNRKLLALITLKREVDVVKNVDTCHDLILRYKPHIINVDSGSGGQGDAVYDMLGHKGHANKVYKVGFGGKPNDKNKFKNKTAEMFFLMRKWFEDQPCDISCLKREEFTRFTAQATQRKASTSGSTLVIESKQLFKNRLKYSPDECDAVMLTFGTAYLDVPMEHGFIQRPGGFVANPEADIY